MTGDGVPPKFLLYHHGDKYMKNLITWYDQDYNQRKPAEHNKLPELRNFSTQVMAWIPERSDYPIQG